MAAIERAAIEKALARRASAGEPHVGSHASAAAVTERRRDALGAAIAPAIAVGAAALVLAAFFLPWMTGDGPFSLRTFSGFDFARLVRNFEITSDTTSSSAQVRGVAVALYLLPAVAVNAAMLRLCATLRMLDRRAAAWALIGAAAYILAMQALLLFLSLVPVNDFAPSVGLPRPGFALTAAGAAVLAWLGRRDLQPPR